ncbi:hypothetical protein PQQ99_18625 [Paraburkholderia sediminicola]
MRVWTKAIEFEHAYPLLGRSTYVYVTKALQARTVPDQYGYAQRI